MAVKENEDTARLKFLAKNLNTIAGSVHIAVRKEKRIIQMYCWLSQWVDIPIGDSAHLDDLRMLIDEAIANEEQR